MISILINKYIYLKSSIQSIERKCYTKDGEVFPVTDSGKTERTKKYKSNGMATKGAEAVINKCGYVSLYKIEEV